MNEFYLSLVIFAFIIPIHELLHYISARNRIVSIAIKPYGVLMRVRSITIRDVMLPQLITLSLLVLYFVTSSVIYLSVALAHVVSSFLDFYSYVKYMRARR